MIKSILAGATLATLCVLAGPALAAPTYNTSLTEGVYYGNGNGGTNNSWTVDNENGIELGLQALTRYVGPVAPATANVYNVVLGNTTTAGKTGSLWGFAFSAFDSSGLSPVTLSMSILDYKYGTTVPFHPATDLHDNGGTDGTNTVGGTSGCYQNTSSSCVAPTQEGIQNAETLSFTNDGASGFDPLYDAHVNNTWLITLTASNTDGQLAQTSILVNAGTGSPLPEPFSLSVMGVGLVGMGLARRRAKAARAG